MIALGFSYAAFLTHLSYIVLERKNHFYKEKMFWLIIIGLAACVYLSRAMYLLF